MNYFRIGIDHANQEWFIGIGWVVIALMTLLAYIEAKGEQQ